MLSYRFRYIDKLFNKSQKRLKSFTGSGLWGSDLPLRLIS